MSGTWDDGRRGRRELKFDFYTGERHRRHNTSEEIVGGAVDPPEPIVCVTVGLVPGVLPQTNGTSGTNVTDGTNAATGTHGNQWN